MLVLGLDPSLTDTGWAIIEVKGNENPFLRESGRIRTTSKELFVIRYARPRDRVSLIIDTYQPDIVSIEIPPPNASWSAGLYPLWISMVEESFKRRIPFITFLPTQIKAYARDLLGDSGKMFKSDMVDAAKRLLKTQQALNHNIADAVIVAWAGARLEMLRSGQLKEEELSRGEKYLFTRQVTRRKTGITENLGMLYKEGEAYYDLRLPKYEPFYMDPKEKAQLVEFSEEIPDGIKKALAKRGITRAEHVMGLSDKEKGIIKELRKVEGIGQVRANQIMEWASLVVKM